MIQITHTAAEGTLLTGDPRPHHQLVKDGGFRWSRRNDFWYMPGSRDRQPNQQVIDRVAARLRDAGLDVAVEVDTAARPVAEREADRADRSVARQDGLAVKADRLAAVADGRLAEAHRMAEFIPVGQPIIAGHHSERRHRKDLERINTNYDEGFAALGESQEATRRAEAAAKNQAHRESAPTTQRRIERLEAERRGVGRRLAGEPCPTSGKRLKPEADNRTTLHCPLCDGDPEVSDRKVAVHYHEMRRPASGEHETRLTAEWNRLGSEIVYWRAHLTILEEQGVKIWGPADFAKGDTVRYWRGSGQVVRVNAKTLSVTSGYSWTDKVPYSDVKGRDARQEEQP